MLKLVTRRRGLAPKEVFGYHAYPLMVHALHVRLVYTCRSVLCASDVTDTLYLAVCAYAIYAELILIKSREPTAGFAPPIVNAPKPFKVN